MKCPICDDVRMREVEKNGVHIDVCPDCKGVWLDRGELDKLMTDVREVRQEYNEWHQKDRDDYREEYRDRDRDRDGKYPDKNQTYPTNPTSSGHRDYDYKNHKPKKKNSVLDVLSDLF
ncbi:TFIIB-type zinc ribbon-containing protein [Paenibacillus eucommiae]|uniref:Zn-finger nucleic acid-binding protein n=1 Tax=Paenibacillus eucommiae TaxID=1355755 RepID=A0ABS4J2K0_9BACL|nr:zf-TFIIB domain-containing protein [Paenibacillus eucommiae]MBP1994055.1 Zn-finger nucleic acid-binding protein [Paenibacillus eucommiae]